MTPNDRPPFRADHVGSLLRPSAVTQARRQHADAAIDATQLRRVEDAAIADAVREQEELGLRAVTDGEFRRGSWHMDFLYQLAGVEKAQDTMEIEFRNPSGKLHFTPAALRIIDKVRLDHTIFGDDFEMLRSLASTAVPKLTVPSPSMIHYRGGRAAIDPAAYADEDEFWSDVSAAYAEQVRRVADLGCRYLQFDDTSLAYLNDPQQRAQLAARGEDAEHLHERYIRQINAALENKPAGMTVTTHMCRGNFRSSWVAEGGYDFVAEALFNELAVDGYFMEWDDERSGDFAPLRFVPEGKYVVLGLVTTKRGELESKDDLKRRVDAATRYIDIDQLCLSPQCGFSSTVDGNALTEAQQWAKLRLVAETAAEIWR